MAIRSRNEYIYICTVKSETMISFPLMRDYILCTIRYMYLYMYVYTVTTINMYNVYLYWK
jgi:hypothetical protein